LFGYIRPFKPELKIREFEEYKSYYCTLCKTLDKEYGFLAKFFLNYDFAFLSLLLTSLQDEKINFQASSCTFNFLKKCSYCLNGDKYFKFTADVSVIFLHYKLKDNILDDSFLKKLFSYILYILTKPAYNKARNKQPFIDKLVKKATEEQNTIEKMDTITLEMASSPSATLLGEVLSFNAKNEPERRILYELGYHLGKWIYSIDALDDYKKDLKNKSFNPFIISKEYNNIKDFSNKIIDDCITGYENAFLLLDIKHNKYILENILFEGNPCVYNKIMRKREYANE
jgi:hypothetical protein